MGRPEQIKTVVNNTKKPSSKPTLRTDDRLPLVDNIYLFGTVGNVVKQLHALAAKQRGGQ